MSKLMVIGAGDFQLPLVQRAAQEGHEVVVVAPAVDERFDKFITAKHLIDVRMQDEILQIAIKEKIDGIVTDQTDIPVRTVAYVAEKMGLSGIGYEVSRLFTDKNLMREKLIELEIPVLPFKLVRNEKEAEDFFDEISGKVILKPTDTQGSRGVIKADSKEAVSEAFRFASSFSQNKTVLIEKCAEGIEFVAEAVTDNFKCCNLICGDTIYFDQGSLFSAKKRIFPSQRPESIVKKVLELNKRIVEGFGLPYGITHGEYITDGDNVYLLEIAARGGGVFISSDLIYERTGFCTEDFLIRKSLSLNTEIKFSDTEVFAGYRAFYVPTGTVTEVSGVEEIKALPYVHRNQLDNLCVGMVNKENVNKTSRIAFIVTAESYEQWEERIDKIKQMLKVTVKSANGLSHDLIWE